MSENRGLAVVRFTMARMVSMHTVNNIVNL